MKEKLESIRESSKYLIETASNGIEHTKKAADLIKNESLKKALLDVCDSFQKTFAPLEENVEARIAYYVKLENESKKRKERIEGRSSRLKEKMENLKNLHKMLQEKMKAIPKPEMKSSKKSKPPADPVQKPELLSAQQLLEQIGQKIISASAKPRTTGNIWENWKQDHPESPPSSNQNDKDKKS